MEKKQIIKQIITFLIITSIITTGIFVWMFNGAGENIGAILLMMWTPGISAILTTLIYKGKFGEYGWKFGKIRFWGYSFILPIFAAFIAYGLAWLTNLADFTTENFGYLRYARWLGFEEPVSFGVSVILRASLGMVFTAIFVLGEEIGWSGFLTPKLLKITSVPITSIIVGVFWSIWHYPAIIGGIYGTGSPLWIALPGFTLVLIGASFLRTVLTLKSKNLWQGVVIHSSHNMFLMGAFWTLTVHKGFANYFVSESGVLLGVIYIIVAVLFWKFLMKKPLYQ